ncbi:MAG: UvrD-helicase domain-containing protein [Candidatus Woesearchaeota archaeon]
MFSQLTKKQKKILNCPHTRVVVKACPGSGKTFSVAARLAKLLSENTYRHQGIAVISFTNVAADEIKRSLSEDYGITKLGYPHFVGTIDSFINKHIFLPFGHLLMNCKKRPEIVGTEFNPWYEYDPSKRNPHSGKITDADYYFDKVSFDKNGKLLPLLPYNSYHLKKIDWENNFTVKGELKKYIHYILNSKKKFFKQGKSNQADANYFSHKILKKYPAILNVLAKKFSHIIIDEAQDTTDFQMSIIDLVDESGIENIMLVGDPNQAIFEWNTADAELFKKKYDNSNYQTIDLDENRRSSDNICKVLNKMVSGSSTSISDVKNDENIPQVKGYNSDQDIIHIKNDFLKQCEVLNISVEKSAILFRGKKFGEEHFQLVTGLLDDPPWENGHYYVRDITHGKYLTEKGYFKDGLRLLEKGYHKLSDPNLNYVSNKFINEKINENGFRDYRIKLFNFIDLLPDTSDKALITWINNTNAILKENGYPILRIKRSRANIKLCHLFHKAESSDYPFVIGTIHSVKGQTFDAVLLFLQKRSAKKHYSKLISAAYNETDLEKKKKDKEELRLVYVACSRPKRLLWIAVPTQDKEIWNNHLGLNNSI